MWSECCATCCRPYEGVCDEGPYIECEDCPMGVSAATDWVRFEFVRSPV
jgi:hypothetical protein